MIEDDPFASASPKPQSLEDQLETASVADLEARIERLKGEILACEQMIASKKSQRAAADSIFGKS